MRDLNRRGRKISFRPFYCPTGTEVRRWENIREGNIMKREKKEANTYIKKIFLFCTLSILVFFAIGQKYVKETSNHDKNCEVLDCAWDWIMPDGRRIPVKVPGEYPVEKNEMLVIESRLPEKMEDDASICIRSSQQDVEVYIDGELRKKYSTEGERIFAHNSMSTFVFVNVTSLDSAKPIQIHLSSQSKYSGKINTIYYGTPVSIWQYFFKLYGMENIVAICVLLLSIVALISSVVVERIYLRKISLKYLAWGIFWVAVWMLSESKFRQLFVANNTIMGTMAYFSVMILPIPFLIYMDELQSYRYHKFYCGMNTVAISTFAINVILQLSDIFDFIQTLWVGNFVIIASIIMTMICIFQDYIHNRIKNHRLFIPSFFVLFIAAVMESIFVYLDFYGSYGTFICFGLIFAFIMAAVSTMKEIRALEEERRLALVTNKLKTEFMIEISKKVRTPLNTIAGTNDLVLREETNPKLREYLLGIKRTVILLQGIVNDVFDYSLMEIGKLSLKEDYYQLKDLYDSVVEEMRKGCLEKGIRFEGSMDEDVPEILYGDVDRILQILVNLLQTTLNEIKEGEIRFHIGGKKEKTSCYTLIFTVEDIGAGISELEISRLYKTFADYTKEDNDENLGLGLRISKNLTELMNGKFSMQSIYGQETNCKIEIPQRLPEKHENDNNLKQELEESEFNFNDEILIDQEKMMSYCNNNKEMFYQVLNIFCKKSSQYAVELEEILRQRNKKEYACLLHSIKSAALTVAADGLCEYIIRQEQLIRDNEEKLLEQEYTEFYNYYMCVVKEAEIILNSRR